MLKVEKIPALGTLWHFEIFDADESERKKITERIVKYIQDFEENYTRFKPTSQIGKLNTTRTFENPSEEFIALLTYGKKLYENTNGVFNFLSAHTQVAQGYGSADTIQKTKDTTSTNPANPSKDLTITKERITLKKGAVDLGGFGKGWLVDNLAKLLRDSFKFKYFLINGGGDIYATSTPDEQPITITIEHPTKEGYGIATYALKNQGFAASSTYKRKWKHKGKEKNHLLMEHKDNIAVNIIAENTLIADTVATTSCVINPQKLPNLLANTKIEYLIVKNKKLINKGSFNLLTE